MLKRLFVFLWCLFIGVAAVQASENMFSISPPTVNLEGKACKDYKGVITVTNKSKTQTLSLKAHVSDWFLNESGKTIFVKAGTIEPSCSKWITISPEQFEILPRRSQKVTYHISVPPEANGDYWTKILFAPAFSHSIPESGKRQDDLNQFCATIYVATSQSERDCVIEELNVDEHHMEATFRNSGQLHLTVKAKLSIKCLEREYRDSLQLPETLILPTTAPFSTRKVSISFKDAGFSIPAGTYQATLIVDYQDDILRGARKSFVVANSPDQKHSQEIAILKVPARDSSRNASPMQNTSPYRAERRQQIYPQANQ